MLISLCTPIMNRLDDFRETIGSRVSNAISHGPVEIVVLDYNSTDGLEDYMRNVIAGIRFTNGSFFTYKKYT